MQVDYLETRLTSNNRADEKIEQQLMKARIITECMNNLIRNNKYLTQKAKSRVYNSTIRPVVSYESETNTHTATTQRNRQIIFRSNILEITIKDKVQSVSYTHLIGRRSWIDAMLSRLTANYEE